MGRGSSVPLVPHPASVLQAEGVKFDSLNVCESLAKSIIEKAGGKIRDKLLASMAPQFVKK